MSKVSTLTNLRLPKARKEQDHFICPQGSVIPFKKLFLDHRTKTEKKAYRCAYIICKACPIKNQCLGKFAQEKNLASPIIVKNMKETTSE